MSGCNTACFGAERCYTAPMPTTRPRIFLTLGEKDEEALDVLMDKWGKKRPDVIRKALREAAAKEKEKAK
jgi:hypothetical protein